MISGGVQFKGKDISAVSKERVDRALKTAVLNAYGDVMIRVWNEGGSTLTSGRKAGRYKNKGYLKYRAKKYGRRNTNINFTLTGDLSRNFKWERRAWNIYVMGFGEMGNKSNVSNAEKYKHLSDKFGHFVQLTRDELATFKQVYQASI